MHILSSLRFAEHVTPPGHPERMERADVMVAEAAAAAGRGHAVAEPTPASRDDLLRVHDARYLDEILHLAGRAAMLDADTFTSPASVEIAALAAGAAVDAARTARQTGEAAIALVRPPGHHAERDRAMGFCLYNNIAVAAAALRADGVERVAIVDIDVHHGNGTQQAFYADPAVLFVSTHQFPFYPGTGAAEETGAGAGEGFTVNLPLPAGTGDLGYLDVHARRVLPALEAFAPEVILVSAGFDAHERDPIGGMRLTTEGYRAIVRGLREAARQLAGGRIAFVTEGGYDLQALGECLAATIE